MYLNTSWQKILLIFFFKIWNSIFIWKKLISFNSKRKQVLEAISPYFALDYLLPRTFVASLNLTHLANIDLSLIPPEVTLAATYFYIKTSFALTRDMIMVCLIVNKALACLSTYWKNSYVCDFYILGHFSKVHEMFCNHLASIVCH